MIRVFKTEGDQFKTYVSENPVNALIRMPEGTMVLTGKDKSDYESGSAIPPIPEE